MIREILVKVMIELRWLNRKTGKTLMNEHGFYYEKTQKVLQYRQYRQFTNYSHHDGIDFLKENAWTEWQDVPEVKE